MRFPLVCLVCFGLIPVIAGMNTTVAQEAEATSKPVKSNSNRLIKHHREGLTFNASSFWNGWPASKAFDGDKTTSWFTAGKDAAALETDPWIEITFPEDVAIRRVCVWGNREESWPTGYSVTAARVEFRDANGKIICDKRAQGVGDTFDFDFDLDDTLEHVRRVRIISLSDQGNENQFSDVAIGEIEIE